MTVIWWLRLIVACLPLIGTITLFTITSVQMKKRAKGFTFDKFAVTRAPTEEEADLIRSQVNPRILKKIVAMCLVLVPFCIIITCVYIMYAVPGSLSQTIGCGLLVFGAYSMLFGLLSAPLSDMHALRKKLYTVSDCRITEIRISYSYRSRSWKPVELRQAITKDDQGFTWVAALPKDLRDVSEGTKCLVVIYDTEDVINRSKRDKMPVYRREIVVL